MVCVGGGAHPPVLRSSMQHTTCSFHTNQHLESSCNNQSIISKQNPHICCATDAAEHTSGGRWCGSLSFSYSSHSCISCVTKCQNDTC